MFLSSDRLTIQYSTHILNMRIYIPFVEIIYALEFVCEQYD
jgi:hypothetical protein